MGTTDQSVAERLTKALEALADVTEFMNDDEQDVMVSLIEIATEIGAGVVRGQKIYGYMDLEHNDRNLLAEAEEEDRDWVTYRLMDFVRERRRREGKDEQPQCTGGLVHDEYTPCPVHDRSRK
jgi:hypothetical protein